MPDSTRTVRSFLSEKDIRVFYDLNQIEQCEFQLMNNNTHKPLREIEASLIKPNHLGFQPKYRTQYLPKASLTEEAKVWLSFYRANIRPTSHHGNLNLETAIALPCFITQKPVRVELMM